MALEFFIRNLSTEIIQECKKEDIECQQNFILYYLTLLAYDPIWNLHPKMKEIVRIDAVRLINYVVAKMHHQFCPCIITMKMQFYFKCNFEEKDIIVVNQRENFRRRIKPLEDEIVESKGESSEELSLLRKRIIYFVTLWRGLGNPTIDAIYQEADYALKSICDDNDLVSFINKRKPEKIDELHQMSQVCGGIRVYNWLTKPEDQQIDDLSKILAHNVESLSFDIQINLKSLMDKIDFLTSAIDYTFETESNNYIGVDRKTQVKYSVVCEVVEGITYEDVEYFKDLLIAYRQQEILLRKLVDEINEIEACAFLLNERLAESQKSFRSLTNLKCGVPTHVIFPLFVELDGIWEDFQNEVIYVKHLHEIVSNLSIYVKDFSLLAEKMQALLKDKPILMDIDRLQVVDKDVQLDFDTKSNITILSSKSDLHLNDVKLEFLGFCVWKLVETQGGLIPGNPNLGILQYKGKSYVFSSVPGMHCFNEDPDQLINEALELARKKPELITLLHLHADLEAVRHVKQLVTLQKMSDLDVAKHDADCQTDLHPVEPHIDKNYKWNVWDHKRDALRLADIFRRRTVSTMTLASGQKGSVKTQTYAARERGNQTKRDNYTNTHQPQSFFFGLRGRKDDKQFILDLTRPPPK